MKLLEVATATAQKVTRPVVGAMRKAKKRTASAAEERRLNPFHRDDKRRAEVNARARGGLDDWIPTRVKNWFGEG